MTKVTFDSDNHRYFLDGLPAVSVTQALEAGGLVDTKWFTQYAAERGSAVHKAIELLEDDDLDMDSVDDAVAPFLESYKKFKAEFRWQSEHSELKVWSLTHHVAGTVDQVGLANGLRCIIDFKTGALSPAVGVQLTGYQLLAAQSRGIKAQRLIAVQLVGDGTYRLKEYKSEPSVFHACVRIAHWKAAL
jgi:hypothetical protein